jgi:hypothetical protein
MKARRVADQALRLKRFPAAGSRLGTFRRRRFIRPEGKEVAGLAIERHADRVQGLEADALGLADGDGDLDVVRADRPHVTVWVNDGTGRFTDATEAVFGGFVGEHVLAVELADFDGDGITDLYLGQLRTFQGEASIRDRLYLGRRP